MAKINLLPHREQKRKKIHQAFYAKLGFAAMTGAASVVAVVLLIEIAIEHQNNINQVIATENQKLDQQVKEVATLKQEIDALKARQHAVENLQNDRNQSIYLMDDLARQVPEGIYLYALSQAEKTVTLNGFAQSNEHVSEFMRNIENNARWTENPQLQEIRSAFRQRTNNANHVFDFTMTIVLKTFATPHNDDTPDDDSDDDIDDSEERDTDDAMVPGEGRPDDLPPTSPVDNQSAPALNSNNTQQAPAGTGTGTNTSTKTGAAPGVSPASGQAPASTNPATPIAPQAPAQQTTPVVPAQTERPVPATPTTPPAEKRDTPAGMPQDMSEDTRALPIETPALEAAPASDSTPQQ